MSRKLSEDLTTLIRVAEYLLDRKGKWVPGYELVTPEVGGTDGLRRKRQLCAMGFPIEKRKMQNSRAYEYRIP